MKRLASSILILIAILGLSVAVGCSKSEDESGPGETMGEQMDEAAEEAGDAAEDAAEGMKEAGEEMKDAMEDATGGDG